jgi:response regulator RpfG family c-di-GMP phosphodiesterase
MHEDINSRRTIFLIEEDNYARRSLTARLRQYGYRLLVCAEAEDAFEWTSGAADIHANLLLVNLVGKCPEDALDVGRKLRDRFKHNGHIPIVVMPDKVPANLEGTEENVNDREWICYYEDLAQLEHLLARLLTKPNKPQPK